MYIVLPISHCIYTCTYTLSSEKTVRVVQVHAHDVHDMYMMYMTCTLCIYMMYIHVHVWSIECRGFESHRLALIFSRKSDCLGCAVLLCLVCLFDLACFFLSFFSSLI